MLRVHREYVLEQRRRWEGFLNKLEEKIVLYEQAVRDRSGGPA